MEEERYDDEFMNFTVKFRVNDANLGVFQDFKEYALINSDDNYLLAIRNLLEKVELYEIFREEYRNGRRKQIKDSD